MNEPMEAKITEREIPEWAWDRAKALAELERNEVTDEMVGRAWGAYCNELTQGRKLVPVEDLAELSLSINGMRRILEVAFAARKEPHVSR